MKVGYWIIGILIGFILLLVLDFSFGRKRHLAKLSRNYFPSRKSSLDIFTHGPDLFTDYFGELRKAKKHIHILFYIVKNDQFSKEFLSLLKEKAQNGVEVRLLVDWVGCSISRTAIKQLKDVGVEFAYSQKPKLPFLFYSSQVRNHRKITVLDGRIGYCGGFNIGKEYNDQDKLLNPWRDYHLKLLGEGVQDLQKQFLIDWKTSSKVNLLQNELYFPRLDKGEIQHQLVPSEGVLLEETFFNLINKAEVSIFIGTPYFIPSRKIFNELLKAINRGVSLTLIVPFIADHPLVQEASYVYLRQLLKKGADIHQYTKGFYHAKVLVIDDAICDIGTANFDKRSMFLNFELNCMIYDLDFIKRIKTILYQDLLDSKKVSFTELTTFNPFRDFKEKTAQMVSYFL